MAYFFSIDFVLGTSAPGLLGPSVFAPGFGGVGAFVAGGEATVEAGFRPPGVLPPGAGAGAGAPGAGAAVVEAPFGLRPALPPAAGVGAAGAGAAGVGAAVVDATFGPFPAGAGAAGVVVVDAGFGAAVAMGATCVGALSETPLAFAPGCATWLGPAGAAAAGCAGVAGCAAAGCAAAGRAAAGCAAAGAPVTWWCSGPTPPEDGGSTTAPSPVCTTQPATTNEATRNEERVFMRNSIGRSTREAPVDSRGGAEMGGRRGGTGARILARGARRAAVRRRRPRRYALDGAMPRGSSRAARTSRARRHRGFSMNSISSRTSPVVGPRAPALAASALLAFAAAGCADPAAAQARLRTAVDAARPSFERCYQGALGRNREAHGELRATLHVAPSGAVDGVAPGASTLDDAELVACVTTALRAVRVEPAPAFAASVAYTFAFRASEPKPAAPDAGPGGAR